jgi:hypothetical protein
VSERRSAFRFSLPSQCSRTTLLERSRRLRVNYWRNAPPRLWMKYPEDLSVDHNSFSDDPPHSPFFYRASIPFHTDMPSLSNTLFFWYFFAPPLDRSDAARTSPVSASSRTVGHPTLLQATFARRSWIDTHFGRVRADLATLRRRVSISLRFAYPRDLELLPSQQASQTQLPRPISLLEDS